ncbi:Ras guanine-nucleotide exchange protein [Drechmeria coniospora]|uniref:Ras guanine-nucleotide exchange protein n=1 Tax=Drechmeria coniospora TaxID=98403 RepID=A0A151GFK2_DRECN|nr:Ras guanine-nucleotide exchange protein [Drechmeria coniospora]KYK55880.1 Ras guanine-nucleotide exchange protein [Drechmeria coniospora]
MLTDCPTKANIGAESPASQKTHHADNVVDGSCVPHDPVNLYLQSHMTPPATPNGSSEDLDASPHSQAPPDFHNFLRAFYSFNPSYAMTDSSVTLPLEEGDVVLIHSVHTNGWADGTLLATGARGWLPTNYCDAYEPDEMRSLLKALLNFWDLLRSTSVNDNEMFRNQEFMKGIVAGVRFLLERSNCLNRESPVVQRSERLRRGRKSLLSELSSLVKTSKRLQDYQRGAVRQREGVNDIIDEMILKAFKIVIKGVHFLDMLEDERSGRGLAALAVLATVAEESYIPPTPPAERLTFDRLEHGNAAEVGPCAAPGNGGGTGAKSEPSDVTAIPSKPWNKRMSSLNASVTSPQGSASQKRLSQGSLNHVHRLSTGMAHRLSLAGPSPLSRPQHLVSERLNCNHDRFLSHLGSFIGRLHLQFHSRSELATAIKQSATSGGDLLAVIDGVGSYNSSSSAAISQVRMAMFERIQTLVFTARDTLANAASEGTDIIMPQDNSCLLAAATDCVRTAGECVAKTKAAIERVGDFEFEVGDSVLDVDLSILDVADEPLRSPSITGPSNAACKDARSLPACDTSTAPATRPAGRAVDKPLPQVPRISIPTDQQLWRCTSPESSRSASFNDDNNSSAASSVSSVRPAMPTLPELSTASRLFDRSSAEHSKNESDMHSSRFDSVAASSAGSTATYLSRDSEASLMSQTSTRATTPDHVPTCRDQPSVSELGAPGNSSHGDEADEVEMRLLEKTFAHELMFNKEGQVVGGSLPALVERLTTHESTPDAAFVSTFYLTFRLFCTPLRLTEALIDRFDYVADSPHMSVPVRLRVYNSFKGWLESHWRDQTDREALKLIIPFAEFKLASVRASAGNRLLELARRVSGDGSLVPRLVSSMGKTNTAIAQYVPADAPLPQPAISKSQQHFLAAFKTGGTMPTILDFESVELARQLTIKQMGIFCSILPQELLASQWMKNGGAEAPHVKAMSSMSTDLSNLVADTILQYCEIKKRAAVIKQWIKIAHQCLELHNYDGLMAIICSLNSSTISRLRKTWDVISPKRKEMLRNLQEIVEPSQNNKVLRARLHDHVPPCLPFLGMYLTDLTFVDIGNPATKQMSLCAQSDEEAAGGLTVVNFDKHSRTAKIIGELQRFQIPYRLMEVPDMQDWLTAQIRRVRDGDQGKVQVSYYRKSLLLEPRESSSRREGEPPTPTSGAGSSRTDLFAWMSRDRGGQTPTPALG